MAVPPVEPQLPSPVQKYVVLIDLENVPHPGLGVLTDIGNVEVYVFIGAREQKLPTELAVAVQVMGSRAHYVQTGGIGKNALDFHVAYYLGQLTGRENDASYHIVSKDGGFDPLIAHLTREGVNIGRSPRIADLPFLPRPRPVPTDAIKPSPVPRIAQHDSTAGTKSPAPPKTPVRRGPMRPAAVAKAFAERLKSPKAARPRTGTALLRWLQNSFGPKMTEASSKAVVEVLRSQGLVKEIDGKLQYNVPCEPALLPS